MAGSGDRRRAHVRGQPADGLVRQGPDPWRQWLEHVLRQPDDGPGDDRRGIDQLDAAPCEGDVGAIETQFMRALVGATSFAIDEEGTWFSTATAARCSSSPRADPGGER